MKAQGLIAGADLTEVRFPVPLRYGFPYLQPLYFLTKTRYDYYTKNETTMIDSDDRRDQFCTECGIGRYVETSIHDDWDGVLHCNNKKCNHEVKRYRSDDNPEPVIEKAKLSPAAQAVLDAAINVAESPDAEAIAAAVLRFVANQVEPTFNPSNEWEEGFIDGVESVQNNLYAIATELEA